MRVDRHAGIPPCGDTAKRVNRQAGFNPRGLTANGG